METEKCYFRINPVQCHYCFQKFEVGDEIWEMVNTVINGGYPWCHVKCEVEATRNIFGQVDGDEEKIRKGLDNSVIDGQKGIKIVRQI